MYLYVMYLLRAVHIFEDTLDRNNVRLDVAHISDQENEHETDIEGSRHY